MRLSRGSHSHDGWCVWARSREKATSSGELTAPSRRAVTRRAATTRDERQRRGKTRSKKKKKLFSRYFGGGVRASQARSSFADAEVKGPCLSSPISLSSRRQSLPPLRFVGFPEARASIRPTNRPNPLGFGVGSPKISRVLASDFFPFQSILISVVNSVGFIVLTSGLVLYFYCRGARSSGVLSILLSNFRG